MDNNPRTPMVLHLADAPCYCEVADDGAPFRCHDCQQQGHAKDMFFTLTPNGTHAMYHKSCLEQDWLDRAKKIPGAI